MKKSIYSLVLMDRVVAEIDKLAYKSNTNRSSLINSILAEYLSMVTPQDINNNIYDRIYKVIGSKEEFVIQPYNGQASLIVKSALNYKYNPVVKYSVELYGGLNNELGCIKANVRTQNLALIAAMNDFYKIFANVENSYIDFGDKQMHYFENGKFKRKFVVPNGSNIKGETIGEAISLYLEVLDNSLKTFFNYAYNYKVAAEHIEELYAKYLKKQRIII